MIENKSMLKPRLDSVQAATSAPEKSDATVAMDHSEAWQRVCRRLRAEVGEDVFNSWFGRLELDEVHDDVARLSVPTKFLKSWIQSHYTDRIIAVMASELPGIASLSISVRTSGRIMQQRASEAPAHRAEEAAPRSTASLFAPPNALTPRRDAEITGRDAKHLESEALGGSPLDRRLSFTSFLVGKSNQLAHAAAQRVAQAPASETPIYNPLYIHASVGLGKTHLIQAIAHCASEAGRRVIYLTAEKFMYGFVSALKAQTAIAFKEKLRAIDVLVIDDVQFLQGKSIQQEFCHTLNALIDAGRQVVIAADRPPSDLESLDERVRSRLAGGLCVEMGALDEALRIKILETRIAAARVTQPTFEVPAPVVTFVARSIQTNGRDLDGAVNRLLAHVTLTGAPLTVETAETAIRDLVRTREPKRVKIEDIQKLVATHFNVSRADILSSRRTATVVRPRQIAMYLAKVLTLRSLPEIGRRFGGRDHTTVLHAVRKIEGLSNKDGQLNEELELLKRMLMD
jgi:chromosomal replication initiator protein